MAATAEFIMWLIANGWLFVSVIYIMTGRPKIITNGGV